jgi:arylsulfatase A-like enzyme
MTSRTQRLALPIAATVVLAALVAQTAPAAESLPPPSWPQPTHAPSGAPTVLLVMTDDVGFGASSTFGGPVATPTLDRLASNGVRYNMMHTVGICSPTRAALLTGRNHTAVAMGNVTDAATGYEGYTSVIPKSAATVARVLRDAGYSTAMFGKSHMIPSWETGPSGPFDHWPTGLGFQHFYGFLGGDTNQFVPALYSDTRSIDPSRGHPDYILDRDLADQAILWMRQQAATAPGRPVFVYYATGTSHAPHQAPRDWIDRYKGAFDAGWDEVRQSTLARQKKLGVVPPEAQLAERFAPIPAWADLSPMQQRVYAREMEVYAGALAFADHEIGRVVDEAHRLFGDNVLVIYLQGDNGASGEGGLNGTLNEHGVLNGVNASLEEMDRHRDEMGGPLTYGHYSTGWANAMNTPLPLVKQLPSHLGAVRNGMVINWPGKTNQPEAVRHQFAHVIDIMPTILDATGISAPSVVDGVEQQPLEGVSLKPTFMNPKAPEIRETQFFVIWDNMGIYHDGWWAGTWPHAWPWELAVYPPTQIEGRKWQLFDLRHDFSQTQDLASQQPTKLAEMQALFWSEAAREKALPVHRHEGRAGMPSNYAGLTKVRFDGPQSRLPEEAAPSLVARSFRLEASVDLPSAGASGVLLAVGGRFGGMSWYLSDGRPTLYYNLAGVEHFQVASGRAIGPGQHVLEAIFDASPRRGGPASVTLRSDGEDLASGKIDRTLSFRFSLDETMDIGSDQGTPVTDDYQSPADFTGALEFLTIDFSKPAP